MRDDSVSRCVSSMTLATVKFCRSVMPSRLDPSAIVGPHDQRFDCLGLVATGAIIRFQETPTAIMQASA